MKENKIMKGSAANILREQYMGVFMKLMPEYAVNNPHRIFNINENCEECEKNITHICKDDQKKLNISPTLIPIVKIS